MRAAAVGTEKAGKGKESVGRQTVLPDSGKRKDAAGS